MASLVLVIAITDFLAGGAAAVFVMLVTGIREADRRRGGPVGRNTLLDAATRAMRRAITWPSDPVVHGDCEQR
jgi:hypothetical protein